MPTVRRYSNRKLYDLDARRYVTLEEIGRLVRSGEEVQVVDYATGADLTTATLVQVLFEEQRLPGNVPPLALLTHLVNRGLRGWAGPAPDPAGGFADELRRRAEVLVEDGRLTHAEAERIIALFAGDDSANSEEVQSLLAQVERLEQRLKELGGE